MENNISVKPIYTTHDFELMGWHDCTIYAIHRPSLGETKLLLDIDYIFKWINPVAPSPYYHFYISPATLVFEDVASLRMSIETNTPLQINELTKPKNDHKLWKIECQQGLIEFSATQFTQYNRRKPIETEECSLGRSPLNPVSFATTPFPN